MKIPKSLIIYDANPAIVDIINAKWNKAWNEAIPVELEKEGEEE